MGVSGYLLRSGRGTNRRRQIPRRSNEEAGLAAGARVWQWGQTRMRDGFEIVLVHESGITGSQRILFHRQSVRDIINHNASQDLLVSRLDNHSRIFFLQPSRTVS